jgi:hypothetical protein
LSNYFYGVFSRASAAVTARDASIDPIVEVSALITVSA